MNTFQKHVEMLTILTAQYRSERHSGRQYIESMFIYKVGLVDLRPLVFLSLALSLCLYTKQWPDQ